MNEIGGVIFDLDGTLADTIPLICAAWNASVPMYTHRTYTDAEVIARFGIPDAAMIRREIPGRSAEHAIQVYHEYYQQHHDRVKIFDGIQAMLTELARREVALGLMTGKSRHTADITLRALGWGDIFASVVTGDEVEHQKPHAEGPLKVARALRVEASHCAFVGDSPADIGAGRNAKMLTIAAAWASLYVDELRQLQPDAWAGHPREVVSLVTAALHQGRPYASRSNGLSI